MTSYSLRISQNIKYLFTAAVTAFFTSNCVSSYEQKLLPTYESETGLKFPQSVVDLACLANTFPSQFKQKQDENNICFSQVLQNYTEIKEINGLLYDEIDQSLISNTYPSLGIKGFHLKVFERKVSFQRRITFVFYLFSYSEN
jgi:hypothetical protein